MRLKSLMLGLTFLGGLAEAQERRQGLPRDVVRDAIDTYNSPSTLRADGRLDISVDQEVRGDVAVLNGPLIIAGHVRGRVVAINADVVLRAGARVGNGILVVGGTVEGRDEGAVDGEIRVFREVLYYHRDGERIAAEEGSVAAEDDHWWSRRRERRSSSQLRLLSAKTYNRVEGLPILLGPTIRHRDGNRTLMLDLYGVIRTADNLKFDADAPGADLFGHSLRAELRWKNVGFGARSYDVMESVENWQLTDSEVGLASFFLHRDYRDYFNRHGSGAFLTFYAGDGADLTLGYSGERWASRSAADPLSVFRNSQPWRPNPPFENTLVHLATASLRFDTRNDEDHPSTGWLLRLDYERGLREADSLTLENFDEGFRSLLRNDDAAYNRLFMDLRRYNRISPSGELHFRLVMGGWAGKSALPLQRRLSVPGGAGTVPGFDFRRTRDGDDDVGTCNASPVRGAPALCDRIVLFQAEYRGDLVIDLFDWNSERESWRFDVDTDPDWVVFFDAGRGWLVGSRAQGELYYPADRLPSVASFRSDVGVGLEFSGIGLFLAKAISDSKEPVNFFVRLNHRF